MTHLLLLSPELREATERDRTEILTDVRAGIARATAFADHAEGWTAHGASNGADEWIVLVERKDGDVQLQHLALERQVDDLASITIRLHEPDPRDGPDATRRFELAMVGDPALGLMPTADGATGARAVLALAAAALDDGEIGAIDRTQGDRCRLAALAAQDGVGRDPSAFRVRLRMPSPLAPARTIVEESFRRPMQSRHDPLSSADADPDARGAVIVSANRLDSDEDRLEARLEPAHLVVPGMEPLERLRAEAELRRRLGDAS